MDPRGLKRLALMLAVVAALGSSRALLHAEVIDRPAWGITGCRWDAEELEWVTEEEGGETYYVVDPGMIREHRDGEAKLEGHECRWYSQNEDCGGGRPQAGW